MVGIMITIAGMNFAENSARAGIDRRPRIGPITKPTNRSIPVHSPPPTTWANINIHLQFVAIATKTNATASAATPSTSATMSPFRRIRVSILTRILRKGLIVADVDGVAALAVAFVFVAIATNWRWMLMFAHVVGGGLWTGIDLFVGFVIGPLLRALT